LEEIFLKTGQNLELGTKEAVKLQSATLTTLCLRFRPIVIAHDTSGGPRGFSIDAAVSAAVAFLTLLNHTLVTSYWELLAQLQL
jgi:hypothetical protein